MDKHLRSGSIYLITNLVNGKKYVGQTVSSLAQRWREHQSDANRGCNFALHCAIRKYGRKAFTVELLAESLQPFLDELERVFVFLHGSQAGQHGYNLTGGGQGMRQYRISELTRIRMSESAKARKRQPHSEETKQKMAVSKIGNTFGKGRRGKIYAPMTEKAKEVRRAASLRLPKYLCEHCGKEILASHLKQYHGEKCKGKPNVIS
jgi:group I intron endonuclease